jgi:hypothetical protein
MAHEHPDAVAKAKELGATEGRVGINWNWASGFPTNEAAEQFNEWCLKNGYETRGVYYLNPIKPGDTAAVRYRTKSDIVR